MSINKISLEIKKLLEAFNVKFEIHSFDSGVKMIDIWKDDKFYCIQIEESLIGITLVAGDNSFTTVPDKSFHNFSEFKYELKRILLLN